LICLHKAFQCLCNSAARDRSRLQGTHNQIMAQIGRQGWIGAGRQRAEQTRDETGGGTKGQGIRTGLELGGETASEGRAGW
jgi:hypothetical protein